MVLIDVYGESKGTSSFGILECKWDVCPILECAQLAILILYVRNSANH